MMTTPQTLDGDYQTGSKGLAVARALIAHSSDARQHVTIIPGGSHLALAFVEIRATAYAGSGATFLLGILVSLLTARPLDLTRCYVLDLSNRKALLAMIAAYLES